MGYLNGLSKSSNCDDLGCIYFKVIYRLQSFVSQKIVREEHLLFSVDWGKRKLNYSVSHSGPLQHYFHFCIMVPLC